jgi:hypothetical protein
MLSSIYQLIPFFRFLYAYYPLIADLITPSYGLRLV